MVKNIYLLTFSKNPVYLSVESYPNKFRNLKKQKGRSEPIFKIKIRKITMVKRISYSFSTFLISEIEKGDFIWKDLFQKTMNTTNNLLEMLLSKTFFIEDSKDALFSYPGSNKYLKIGTFEGNSLRSFFEKTKRISINISNYSRQKIKVLSTEIFFFGDKKKESIYNLSIIVFKEGENDIESRIIASGHR